MGVDHGQRLVKEQRVHVLADHPATKANLLLGVRSQATCFAVEFRFHADHVADLLDSLGDVFGVRTTVFQWKRQVFADGHGVVDHGELEHLRDVALGGGRVRYVLTIK